MFRSYDHLQAETYTWKLTRLLCDCGMFLENGYVVTVGESLLSSPYMERTKNIHSKVLLFLQARLLQRLPCNRRCSQWHYLITAFVYFLDCRSLSTNG
jgi:hypothetical protein